MSSRTSLPISVLAFSEKGFPKRLELRCFDEVRTEGMHNDRGH